MFKNLFFTLFAVLIVLPHTALAEITYSGSSTIGTGVLKAGAVEAFEKKSGKKFASVDIPGSGKGVKALIEGKVVLAGASRPLKPEEKKEKLSSTTIGYDAVAVFIHKNNPIKNLTKEQLKGIFTGKIRNWQEVGGKNAPIVPNTEILDGKRATIEMFQEHVLDGAPHAKFKQIDLPREQIVEVAKDENAVCTVSLGLYATLPADIRGKVKSISVNGVSPDDKNTRSGAYLISRPLNLVTKGVPKGEVKEFISFIISAEGQAIVSRNFVPVRKGN
ncbi:MAG: phosphate transport system substrate-binding [Geobacteraceae bacterium]|nr:MAG: phosphate transport system substrate-binding [Geobacteraceae bacterium]